MTWEELKEKGVELGYKIVTKYPDYKKEECMCNDRYGFYKDGTVEDECYLDDELCGSPFTEDRTFDQMYQIMLALRQWEGGK